MGNKLNRTKILYVAFNKSHLLQAKSIDRLFDIKILGPKSLNPDYLFSKINFEHGSFLDSLLHLRRDLKDIFENENFDALGISCINYPTNNLIYSAIRPKKIYITGDGSINYIYTSLSTKEKFKDIAKKIISFLFGRSYRIRMKSFNGIVDFKNVNLTPLYRLTKNAYVFDGIAEKKDLIPEKLSNSFLYISIANSSIDPKKYIAYEKEIIRVSQKIHKNRIKILYKENLSLNYQNKDLRFPREKFDALNLSGEQIVAILNPKVIFGDVSSLFLNSAVFLPSTPKFSFLDLYESHLERSVKKKYIPYFKKFKIKILSQ